ncbi:MAG: diiron oxygenase [Burkholderiaceae bacterium]|jgi:hypothetical protein|nr:diiron oxygenase [Burkholderiaceae bacterium]
MQVAQQTVPFQFSTAIGKFIGTLVNSSNRSSMEVDSVLPWSKGIEKSMAPKRAEHCWIYGTKYWDMLTPEQRHELMWLETGRDITAFIKLERFLPVLYVGFINRYRNALFKEIYDYMLIFSKEEIVHTMMFRRFMKLGNLPFIQDAESPSKSFLEDISSIPPIYGVMFTLVVEWAAELNALMCTQYEGCEPLTKKMFYEHHLEEVRHIAFGKRLVESYIGQASSDDRIKFSATFRPIVEGVYNEITYNRLIGQFTSFNFPIGPDDREAIAEVRNSEHNQKINKIKFKEMNKWLAEVECDVI